MVGAAGFRRIYVPELRLEHCIPAGRVQMDYFKRLVASVVRSHLTLTYRYPPRPWTMRDRLRAIGRYAAALLAAPALLLGKDGWRETSLVLTARRAAIRGPNSGRARATQPASRTARFKSGRESPLRQ